MSVLDPANTTAGDLCTEALREAGAIGQGQTPQAQDIVGAQARLQWMLQEWQRRRWMVYHERILTFVSTGAQSYSVGPGGQFDTGTGSMRPARIEAASLRQMVNPQPIDFILERMESMEDYMRVPLKSLVSFSGAYFYDSANPLGLLYVIPIPDANIYTIVIAILEQLPASFATSATKISLPYEYYWAIITNLAIRLRPKYGIVSQPGDMLPGNAKEALSSIKGANFQVPRLQMPKALSSSRGYNIFNDRSY